VRAADKTQIPWVCGCAQVLMGPDGIVHAFAWNGEDVKVHPVFGDFQRSGLSDLDNGVLESLCGSTTR